MSHDEDISVVLPRAFLSVVSPANVVPGQCYWSEREERKGNALRQVENLLNHRIAPIAHFLRRLSLGAAVRPDVPRLSNLLPNVGSNFACFPSSRVSPLLKRRRKTEKDAPSQTP
jgi:hypothetical protein